MANDIDLTGITQRTAGEWVTKGAYADLGVPLVRVSDLAEIVRRVKPSPGPEGRGRVRFALIELCRALEEANWSGIGVQLKYAREVLDSL